MFCGVRADAGLSPFGSKLLEPSGSALSDPQAEALAEVIVSSMDRVSSSLSAQFGVVTFKVDRVEDVRLEEMLTISLDASSEEKAEAPIFIAFQRAVVGIAVFVHWRQDFCQTEKKQRLIQPTCSS